MTLLEITNTIGNIAEAVGLARQPDSHKGAKVSFSEGANIALQSVPLVRMFFNLDELAKEYFALSDDLRNEIVDTFSANFQLENEKAGIIITKIFSVILALEDVVQVLTEKD